MRQPPVIIGAGPSGCAAAIGLAREGYRPLVLERATGPGDKVCGDFLSADTIRLAAGLGVDPGAMGAAPIHTVRLVHQGRSVQVALPFPALGLSRRVFDAALLGAAGRAGAETRMGCVVRGVRREPEGWRVETSDGGDVQAGAVFLATGKHDLRDLPRPGRTGGAVGMKMYYRPDASGLRHLAGTIELTLFPGGYAGVQPVEDGQVVLCCAVTAPVLRATGGWAAVLEQLAASNPGTLDLLRRAAPMMARPLAVANVPYGYLALPAAAAGLFRLGDQGAVIPSLTGDGMAIALHSGFAAAGAWLRGASSDDWQRRLAKTLRPQMRLAMVLHRIALNGSAQAVGMTAVGAFPSLLRLFARRTRLRAEYAYNAV